MHFTTKTFLEYCQIPSEEFAGQVRNHLSFVWSRKTPIVCMKKGDSNQPNSRGFIYTLYGLHIEGWDDDSLKSRDFWPWHMWLIDAADCWQSVFPSLKLRVRTWKWMIGRRLSFWKQVIFRFLCSFLWVFWVSFWTPSQRQRLLLKDLFWRQPWGFSIQVSKRWSHSANYIYTMIIFITL